MAHSPHPQYHNVLAARTNVCRCLFRIDRAAAIAADVQHVHSYGFDGQSLRDLKAALDECVVLTEFQEVLSSGHAFVQGATIVRLRSLMDAIDAAAVTLPGYDRYIDGIY